MPGNGNADGSVANGIIRQAIRRLSGAGLQFDGRIPSRFNLRSIFILARARKALPPERSLRFCVKTAIPFMCLFETTKKLKSIVSQRIVPKRSFLF